MPSLPLAILIGLGAGLVASAVMEVYQGLAAKPFGQKGSSDDSATVKLADDVTVATTGGPVTQRRRAKAGRLVHYLTGLGLGVGYVLAAIWWPPITLGFGVAFGVVVMLVLDDVVVPALKLGPPAWQTPVGTHLYGLTSHVVFGVVLEGVRRLGWSLLG